MDRWFITQLTYFSYTPRWLWPYLPTFIISHLSSPKPTRSRWSWIRLVTHDHNLPKSGESVLCPCTAELYVTQNRLISWNLSIADSKKPQLRGSGSTLFEARPDIPMNRNLVIVETNFWRPITDSWRALPYLQRHNSWKSGECLQISYLCFAIAFTRFRKEGMRHNL